MQMKVKVQIFLCFVSQDPLILSSCNFVWTFIVISRSYQIIKPNWYKAILAMKIKVKGQISFCFVSQEPIIWLTWNFVCIRNLISQLFFITPNWYEALGYANEVQSSNIPLFCISRTSILIELKFGVHIQCD